jgi:hypothetical protein
VWCGAVWLVSIIYGVGRGYQGEKVVVKNEETIRLFYSVQYASHLSAVTHKACTSLKAALSALESCI